MESFKNVLDFYVVNTLFNDNIHCTWNPHQSKKSVSILELYSDTILFLGKLELGCGAPGA